MVVYFTYMEDYAGKNQYPVFFALSVAFSIIASMLFGRVYHGAHSFVDTFGGLLLAVVISLAYIPYVTICYYFIDVLKRYGWKRWLGYRHAFDTVGLL